MAVKNIILLFLAAFLSFSSVNGRGVFFEQEEETRIEYAESELEEAKGHDDAIYKTHLQQPGFISSSNFRLLSKVGFTAVQLDLTNSLSVRRKLFLLFSSLVFYE